jgi:hypothetical protein
MGLWRSITTGAAFRFCGLCGAAISQRLIGGGGIAEAVNQSLKLTPDRRRRHRRSRESVAQISA